MQLRAELGISLMISSRKGCRRTRSQSDIVERKFGDAGIELQEKGQWLSNTSCSAEDCDFGELDGAS